jgi:transcription initiation factor IIF auxiliary subunit
MICKLKIKDTVFDPALCESERKVYVRRSGNRPLYKVWLLIEGETLPYIESVTYKLHRTFSNPIRKVRRTPSNPECKLVIWTWGLFEVKAIIKDKNGESHRLTHSLQYDKQLQLEGVEFVNS